LHGALAGFHRVLVPAGKLMVAVPDLEAVCRQFLAVDAQGQYELTKVIYGSHIDAHDEHHFGFTAGILWSALTRAGFTDIERVKSFGLFEDSSSMSISLN